MKLEIIEDIKIDVRAIVKLIGRFFVIRDYSTTWTFSWCKRENFEEKLNKISKRANEKLFRHHLQINLLFFYAPRNNKTQPEEQNNFPSFDLIWLWGKTQKIQIYLIRNFLGFIQQFWFVFNYIFLKIISVLLFAKIIIFACY
jgi:hypothetical protein